jgi:hypothetical protein
MASDLGASAYALRSHHLGARMITASARLPKNTKYQSQDTSICLIIRVAAACPKRHCWAIWTIW